MKRIVRHFVSGFQRASSRRSGRRRIGAELKFPLVDEQGRAGRYEAVLELWRFLEREGWHPCLDSVSGDVIGASIPGPWNDTVAGCETGFCKVEFSLAHAGDLHELAGMIGGLRGLLRQFSDRTGNWFLGFGIQPVTRPGQHLEMKKSRNVFWKTLFGSNDHISPEEGDDVHLFTVSASSQVHIDVDLVEAVRAVNIFNGFSGAQIALTGNSNVWRGELDREHKCVGEMFWDWWNPGPERYGIPRRPFVDLEDYVRTVAMLSPVFVRREGQPLGLPDYDSFYDYYRRSDGARAIRADCKPVRVTPEPADIDQHGTFYWYNARISRYYTLENRANDQQPPEDLACIAALSLGLACALDEAEEELGIWNWEDLRRARIEACRSGLQGSVGRRSLSHLAACMFLVAEQGLKRRGLGEQKYLAPLDRRLVSMRNPADEARELFEAGGTKALITSRRL